MIKLYIKETFSMNEDIEAVKKYYPNIDDDTFMQLIQLDPTYRGNQSLGKYGKWILNLYNKGNLSTDDMNSITDVLNQFTTYRNRIHNKDLNSYKSLSDLEDILATVVDDDSMLTDRQKLRFLKNVKAGRTKISAEDDYDVVLETPNFIVYVPNTHEASMKLGNGTKWCTAHENPDWYNKYTKDNSKLYIVKNKKTGERWQYSDLEGDFLDEDDDEFNIWKLMQQDEKLSKFFEKFFGVDYYNFDGTWVYDGNEIPEQPKLDITEIIIDKNVTKIEENAFCYCKRLTSVYIPNSVIEIGDGAFKYCSSLESIDIPNSVTKIGDWAFKCCSNLISINIPNSVTEIGGNAFYYCYNLTSINIPNSVTEIRAYTFSRCENLTSVNIPNSVTEIRDNAFSECKSLTSINIPDSVTKIEESVFSRCYNLTSINIPNSVTEIGSSTFSYCESLTSINIPNSVTEIAAAIFFDCKSLKSINIPNSVTKIGYNAFKDCNNLVVYTNNNYVKDYCNKNNIPTKPLNNNESFKNLIRLHIREN